jgi:hypothetical protein
MMVARTTLVWIARYVFTVPRDERLMVARAEFEITFKCPTSYVSVDEIKEVTLVDGPIERSPLVW